MGAFFVFHRQREKKLRGEYLVNRYISVINTDGTPEVILAWKFKVSFLRVKGLAMTEQMEPLIPSNEAARYLVVTPNTLRVWRWRGEGPEFVKIGGPRGRVLYEPAAIRRWIAERTVTSSP